MSDELEISHVPSPTKECSKSIQAIDREAVHRICSGQVVLNLATAVKELVENSLDAGATSIEIRLREYGSEIVEVVDNGCGVEEANFEGLTLKHHTSKLREFADLLEVETFGFRGEALSSLCALSEMTVTTRHASSGSGTKLTYDSRGLIVSKSPCARQIGTTVALANLFSPLPVRQKEFLRNLKREFAKMSQLLHAYCLVSTGVKILCSNQTKKGGKTVIVSTQGSSTFKGNIMCIFGAKQASSLLDIGMQAPEANNLEENGLSSITETNRDFQLEGCISSCAHGQGRSSTDRQFYYINSRPCDPSKVSKVVNEVYHQFNLHQFPFVFLNIKTPRDSVDVNVTPDKRQIFLDNEKLLIATVKASLLKLYEKIPHIYEVQNVSIGSSKNNVTPSNAIPSRVPSSSSNLSSPSQRSTKLSSLLKNFSHSFPNNNTQQDSERHKQDTSSSKVRGVKRALSSENCDRDGRKQLCLSSFISSKKCKNSEILPQTEDITNDNIKGAVQNECMDHMNDIHGNTNTKGESRQSQFSLNDSEIVLNDISPNFHSESLAKIEFERPVLHTCDNVSDELQVHSNSVESGNISHEYTQIPRTDLIESDVTCVDEKVTRNHDTKSSYSFNHRDDSKDLASVFDGERNETTRRKTVSLNVTLEMLQAYSCNRKKHFLKEESGNTTNGGPRIRFYAEIDPSKNKNAEQELKKEISKDMFSKMKIIGQFNLGFIITKLGHDLFIVDQHATDEKYNFEMLQTHAPLKNQKLVVPQALELTAVNESILMDNIEIFLKNGFNFVIDKDDEPTKRVRLAAKPISHNWEFGKEDIDELLFMLQDSPHTMCRPSRVRAMFASRACRKSVMIGTALSKSTMRQLIDHMGEIEQPWNCPHGRPTMRHLVNLELVQKRK